MKVDIISGFLGSGKTTLIQVLMKQLYAQEKILIIENEFGEIGIDATLLRREGYELRELNAGCICCSINGDFEKMLEKILKEVQVDRIVIEPSGVANLSDIINSCKDYLIIERKIVVVDGTKFPLYFRNFQSFFKDQIQEANIIFINRKKENTILQVLSEIKFLNENVMIFIDEWGLDYIYEIVDLPKQEFVGNETNTRFYLKVITLDQPITKEEFAHLLETVTKKRYLRAKGIVLLTSGEWRHFEYAGHQLHVESFTMQSKSGYVIIHNEEIIL